MTTPDQPEPDVRAAAKALIHPALHKLDVRIQNLPGACHCNLIAEVVLDALYGPAQAKAAPNA